MKHVLIYHVYVPVCGVGDRVNFFPPTITAGLQQGDINLLQQLLHGEAG